MTTQQLAVLGGDATFPQGLPLTRPTIPDIAAVTRRLDAILRSGILTNGPTVRELEERVTEYCGVQHAVAVSNCTAGLMLTLQAWGATGRVVMPSMTFAASAHAVVWAGGTPVWAEVDPCRLTLDPRDAASVMDGCVALSATHIYGAPCQVEALEQLAKEAGVRLLFDAAHALGSKHFGKPVGGFGDAEVFSMSPTKVAVAGEGGIVTTNDSELAAHLRKARDYGNPGTYDCDFVGINARMSELHAAVGLASLSRLDEHVARRNELVHVFKERVDGVPGITFQDVDSAGLSTYKDLTLIVDAERFGLNVPSLRRVLTAEGVDTRRYYHPPIHRQKAYAQLLSERDLPVTEEVAERVLTVPLSSHMADHEMCLVGDLVAAAHEQATSLRATT